MSPIGKMTDMAIKALQGWNQLRADWDMFLGFHPGACFVALAGVQQRSCDLMGRLMERGL